MTRSRGASGVLLATAGLVLTACAGASSSSNPAQHSAQHSAAPRVATPATTATIAYSTVTVTVPAGMGAAPFDRTRTLTVPKGWHAAVWARVDNARLETWTPDKRLLVSRPQHGDIVALTPRGTRAPAQRTLISGLSEPHGLAFHGSTLWVAEVDRIDTFRYSKGKLTDRHTVVSGLPGTTSGYHHPLKSVVVDAQGNAYFSIGSSDNISASDRYSRPQAADIDRWDARTHKVSVYARGVRNGTGLAIDPAGALWTAVNNRDQMPYPYHKDYDGDGSDDYGKVITGYVNDHPIEPVAKLRQGRDLGWPYCDPTPDVSPGSRTTALTYRNRPFVRDPDTNADGSKLDCSKLTRLENGLPAHSAPLGMSFATLPAPFGSGALIAVHGSWNRQPPRSPRVWFLSWSTKRGLTTHYSLVSGFQAANGSRWGRPVAAVKGPDGAYYVTDDQAGAIYRITA